MFSPVSLAPVSRPVAAWLLSGVPGVAVCRSFGPVGPAGVAVLPFSGPGSLARAGAVARSAAAAGLVAVVVAGPAGGRLVAVAPRWSCFRRRGVLAALGLSGRRLLAWRFSFAAPSPAGGWFALVPAGR